MEKHDSSIAEQRRKLEAAIIEVQIAYNGFPGPLKPGFNFLHSSMRHSKGPIEYSGIYGYLDNNPYAGSIRKRNG